MGLRHLLAALLMAGSLVAGAACAPDQNLNGPASSGGLSSLLPDSPGSGLPSNVQTEQTLDAGEAATALPSDSTATAAQLAQLRFRSGYTRVWGTSSTFVSMAVLAFPTVPAAESFVAFERSNLTQAVNTFVTAHAEIPGSYVFVISSTTKQGGVDVMCNGVWFRLQVYAFDSLACNPTPTFATQIEAAARSEYDHARSQLGP